MVSPNCAERGVPGTSLKGENVTARALDLIIHILRGKDLQYYHQIDTL